MRRRAFAITLSGLLAAPGVMAACNPQFDRIETRIQASAAPQAQKSRLLAWVGDRRLDAPAAGRGSTGSVNSRRSQQAAPAPGRGPLPARPA
jgi:hypothetical protein